MKINLSVESASRDLRYAIRGLCRNPGFSLAAIVTLGLGIGATTLVFTVINGVLIRPLAYPEPDRLVGIWHTAVFQGLSVNNFNLSPPMYAAYRDLNQTFDNFGVWQGGAGTVTGLGDPEQVRSLTVTQGVLPALNVPPLFGRWFSTADDTPGTPETALLSYGYWQRRFGGDRSVIGRTLTVDSRPRQIIGVMPERFHFQRSDPDVILPQRFPGNLQSRNADYFYFGIARLKPGVTLAQANGDVARMLPLWDKKTMEVMRMGPALRSLKEDVVGDIGSVLWVLMGTVGMVLLIACANVANLLLVRTAGRQRELAIRSALGAGWYQIVREMLLENLALGFCGGVFGLLLAFGGLRLLIVLRPANLPRLNEIVIDPLTLIVLGATSLLSALLFGLIPAVRQAAPHIAMMLGSGGRTASQSRERQRSQNTLVVVQVALALVLLVAAGLMIRTFQALVSVQPGVTQPDQLQIARISIPQAQVASPDGVVRMQNDILERIAAIPGVVSAGFATAMPTEDPQNRNLVTTDNTLDAQLAPIRVAKNISPGLLKTQGTPLLAGRDFTWTDIYEKRPVAIVSERLAQESWGGVEAALGRRIRLGVVGEWREIVGVAGNVYDEGVNQKPSATIYWRAGEQQGIFGAPNSAPRSIAFAIRTNRAGTESFLNELRQAVWSVNPNLPLSQVRTLGDILSRSIARTSFTLVMLAIAGLMALVLGVVGIYGVMSYSVSQRTREIGIRLAFGAQQHSIKRRFVCQGLLLAFAGVAIGLAAAVPLTRLMTSLLFGVQPLDPITLAVVAAILAIAAASASYLPARRVSAVDPVEALKAE